jgi:predicted secreted protein
MSWISGAAIFFIIWWTTLFAVLPFGVRNSSEAGRAVGDGHDAGAPVVHGLRWKLTVTTVLALVIFFGFRFPVCRRLSGCDEHPAPERRAENLNGYFARLLSMSGACG